MAYPNETWGERDSRRWYLGIAISVIASVILGIAWLAFGVGGNLLVYSLAVCPAGLRHRRPSRHRCCRRIGDPSIAMDQRVNYDSQSTPVSCLSFVEFG
jgi:hypothetical protein